MGVFQTKQYWHQMLYVKTKKIQQNCNLQEALNLGHIPFRSDLSFLACLACTW